ncbi:conserved hypothetical protein [Candidatus Defluviicoccus seviourii]|uniref:Uncharacterized protein n=2 Tax=root TaxID=1 RepID=A0A564WBJ2_9PROT|nr:conserved hypothetical protein [uncultured Defluviicoccus sp.]VUX44878.1 conserved hypothetical protein [Candidatus Defluviicoccus seviourii]
MEVIGEHNPGVDLERVSAAGEANGIPELIDVPGQQVIAAPLQQIDGKEITPSQYAVSAVVGNLSLPPSPGRHARRNLRPAGHASL